MSQDFLYYQVVIDALTGSAPADGFINNLTPKSYITPGSGSTYDMEVGWPTDLNGALASARGNLRWEAVLQQLSSVVTPFAVTNVVPTGANATTPATSMNFTVVYDRPDYLYAYDEANPGTMLYNEDAITRWIARALMENINSNIPVLDPTPFTSPNVHYGESIRMVNAGPLAANLGAAEAAITVTPITATSGSTFW